MCERERERERRGEKRKREKGNGNSEEVIIWLVETHALTKNIVDRWRVCRDTEHKSVVFTVRRHGSLWLPR